MLILTVVIFLRDWNYSRAICGFVACILCKCFLRREGFIASILKTCLQIKRIGVREFERNGTKSRTNYSSVFWRHFLFAVLIFHHKRWMSVRSNSK